MAYLLFKLLHVLAVIVFLGNITVGVFWKAFADRTKDANVIAHTMDGIIRADRIFTIPSVVALLVGGFGAAGIAHIPIVHTGWLLWGLVLFIVSGIAFGPLSRAQRRLLAAARDGAGTIDWQAYEQQSRRWKIFGAVALAAPYLAAIFMILKPHLPALP
jgi:uncharacterized membrane protein